MINYSNDRSYDCMADTTRNHNLPDRVRPVPPIGIELPATATPSNSLVKLTFSKRWNAPGKTTASTTPAKSPSCPTGRSSICGRPPIHSGRAASSRPISSTSSGNSNRHKTYQPARVRSLSRPGCQFQHQSVRFCCKPWANSKNSSAAGRLNLPLGSSSGSSIFNSATATSPSSTVVTARCLFLRVGLQKSSLHFGFNFFLPGQAKPQPVEQDRLVIGRSA